MTDIKEFLVVVKSEDIGKLLGRLGRAIHSGELVEIIFIDNGSRRTIQFMPLGIEKEGDTRTNIYGSIPGAGSVVSLYTEGNSLILATDH